MVTPVTTSKNRNYISSDAHFSGFSEHTGLMIYGSFLIEKNAKYSKKCDAICISFSRNGSFFISSVPELPWH
jgi:hypothetical protein